MPDDSTSHGKAGQSETRRRTVLKSISGSTVAGIASLAGCAGSNQDNQTTTEASEWPDLSGKEVHLLTDETAEPFKKVINRVSSDFEQATGAKVNVEYVSIGGDINQRLSQLIQSGDPPELTFTGASEATRFVQQGAAGKLNRAVNATIERWGEPPESTRVRVEGDDYLMPWWGNIGVQWYRSDLYEEEPKTWSSLLEQAEQVHNSKQITGSFVPAGTDFCTKMFVLGQVYANGGTLCERQNGEVKVVMGEGQNRKKWVEALTFIQDLHQYSPQNSDAGCSQMATAIPSETAAHTWYTGARPKIQSISQNKAFAADLHPSLQPVPEGREQNTTLGLSEGVVTFKQADVEAANVYGEFLFQEKYAVDLMMTVPLHNIPSYPDLRSSDGYQNALKELPGEWSDEDVNTMLQSTQDYQTLATETDPPNPWAGAIYGASALADAVFDVTVRGNSPESVVDTYSKEITQIVEDAKS